ncbi:MAG: hypothetical protein NVSMB30_25360 [Hymenobacter sp.]
MSAIPSGSPLPIGPETLPHPRIPLALEASLPAHPVREQADPAEALRLASLFEEVPGLVARLAGPTHVLELANDEFRRVFGQRTLVGKPFREALPELAGQGFFDRLDDVYRTGAPFRAVEMPAYLDRTNSGQLELGYFNFIYQAHRDAAGAVVGVYIFAHEVTEPVLARQLVQQQGQALAAINAALQAANEGLFVRNAELQHAQQQVQQLNQALETRVQKRTRQLETARADTEAQRQQLETLFMQAPAPIMSLSGPAHVITLANPHYGQLCGHRPLVGRSIREALPELEGQPYFGHLDAVYRTGEPFYGNELPVYLDRTNSGQMELGYYNYINQATRDAAGAITGVLVFAFEVTEHVLARQRNEALLAEMQAATERQLKEREAFYQVFEQTPALITILRGPDHRFAYCNAAQERVFPGRQLLGQPLAAVLPDAATQGFVALLDQVYATGEPHVGTEVPAYLDQPAGRPPKLHYFTFTYQRFEEDGAPAGISVFGTDVTGQVCARQEREVQRERLEQLFMQAPAAICILHGPEMVFEFVNPCYQQLFPGRPLLGRPLLDVVPEVAAHAVYHTFRHVYQTGLTHQEQGVSIPLVDPGTGQLEDRYFNYVQQARHDAAGRVDGVLVFAFEVTEQVRARQQVQHLNAELTATNQQLTRTNANLDTFIYTASHDLKQPIANIEGLLLALREQLPAVGPTETEAASLVPQLLSMMQGAVDRFQLTIAQLTDITRLQQAQAQPAETVGLAELVDDLRLDLAPLLAAHGGTSLTTDVAACPEVSFAPQYLRSIVYNLLSNAIKYRHPDRPPAVQLRCRSTAAAVVLDVQDNGLGLTPDQQSRLFGMFVRLHDHVEGSGIGLYMVKKIVENAGGTIAVQSQPGVGSTFTVTLPR